jgi:uncharacterized protein
MTISALFTRRCPIIGCVHLLPLPGAPLYDADIERVYETALSEAKTLTFAGVDGLIVENFRDKPFFPHRVPAETIASLSAISREIIKEVNVPIGINVLRSDGESAMAIATAVGAAFIRVNVHMGAIVSEQGLILGKSHETLRLRSSLKANVLIFADVGVKHAAPLADRGLRTEAIDATERGLVDVLIISGQMTGQEADVSDVETVRSVSPLPIFVGSGIDTKNINAFFGKIDGAIVGTSFKKDGISSNFVEKDRVDDFIKIVSSLRGQR